MCDCIKSNGFAGFIFLLKYSHMLFLANYLEADENTAGSSAGCVTQANTFWSVFYYIAAICLFFLFPLIVLVLIYTVIARHLVADPCTASNHRIQVKTTKSEQKYKKRVSRLLGCD